MDANAKQAKRLALDALAYVQEAYGVEVGIGTPERLSDDSWVVPILIATTFGSYRCGAIRCDADGNRITAPDRADVLQSIEEQRANGNTPTATPMLPSCTSIMALTSGCAQLAQARAIVRGEPEYSGCTLQHAVASFDAAIRIFRTHATLFPASDLEALQRERDGVAARAE